MIFGDEEKQLPNKRKHKILIRIQKYNKLDRVSGFQQQKWNKTNIQNLTLPSGKYIPEGMISYQFPAKIHSY